MEAIKFLVGAYDIATLPAYYIAQRPWERVKKAREVRAVQEDANDPYSAWARVGTPPPSVVGDCKTIPEVMKSILTRYGDEKCMGVRRVIDEMTALTPDGKPVTKKWLAPDYDWFSFNQIDARIESMMKGFLMNDVKPKDTVIIFMETRIEWMLAAQALFRLGATIGTLYSTLGEDGIIYGANQLKAATIITSSDLLRKLNKLIPQLPHLKTVVYASSNPSSLSTNETVQFVNLDELEKQGSASSSGLQGSPPTETDVALIVYTSGSTGIPKGVVITHANFVSTMESLNTFISLVGIQPGQTYIGYLPLAHMLEFTVEHLFLSKGMAVGYSSALTLTNNSPSVVEGELGDVMVLKPHIMVMVPLILDRLKKSITESINGKGPFFSKLFDWAMTYKTNWTESGYGTPILDRILFKKIRASLGGNVATVICGGAPLSPDVQLFVRNCLCVRLMQGFGATETAAVTSVSDVYETSVGRCGAPPFGAKVKLIDWEEGNYRVTDKPHPRGEIVVSGGFITKGYYEKQDETDQCYYDDKEGRRWFLTGDIGEFFEDGTLKIIDRKKDLIKLKQGEFVSLGKIESEIKCCSLVDNICVYGDGIEGYLVALVVPNQLALRQLANRLGKDETIHVSDLCDDLLVVKEVLSAIQERGRIAKLTSLEIPKKIKLCREDWTPDNGLVTAALKIRRVQIRDFYRKDIVNMYSSNGA